MTNAEKIDRALAGVRAQSGGRAETEGVSYHQQPQRETRAQAEKERYPDYYTRQREQEGRSNWSGGGWGGRSR